MVTMSSQTMVPAITSIPCGSTSSSSSCTSNAARTMLKALVLAVMTLQVSAWGSSSGDDGSVYDASIYGNALDRDWLYSGTGISMKFEGCIWGTVEDNEDSGCMEDSSEDGTTYWYQMANCRRAQAVYSIYAASSSHASCNGGNFKETFVTKDGLPEFIYYLATYDSSSPFSSSDDDGGGDDGGNYNDNFQNLPMCTQVNGNYVGLGCADDGTFALEYFSDAYCLTPSGSTYDKLRTLNSKLKSYKSCTSIGGTALAQYLIASSDSCSSLDSSVCTDSDSMKNMRSFTNSRLPRNGRFASGSKSWLTKLKYVTGGLLLLASFVMFTGILFTNRRRRRALMQRKYRQRGKDGRSRKSSSRSKSKGRDGSKGRSGSKSRDGSRSRRSKSRNREEGAATASAAGVFT